MQISCIPKIQNRPFRRCFGGINTLLLKIFKGIDDFPSHAQQGQFNYFAEIWGYKLWSVKMLYTTTSKYLQKIWNWPYVYSVEKSLLPP